jgi:hypothetical protein
MPLLGQKKESKKYWVREKHKETRSSRLMVLQKHWVQCLAAQHLEAFASAISRHWLACAANLLLLPPRQLALLGLELSLALRKPQIHLGALFHWSKGASKFHHRPTRSASLQTH